MSKTTETERLPIRIERERTCSLMVGMKDIYSRSKDSVEDGELKLRITSHLDSSFCLWVQVGASYRLQVPPSLPASSTWAVGLRYCICLVGELVA